MRHDPYANQWLMFVVTRGIPIAPSFGEQWRGEYGGARAIELSALCSRTGRPSIHLAERSVGGWPRGSRHGRWARARNYWSRWGSVVKPYTCLARIGCRRVTCDLPPLQIAMLREAMQIRRHLGQYSHCVQT
jgi:hypothetical protein